MTEYKLTRKVQEIAGATLTVALPKSWAEANGVMKGTEVELRYNGVVKILPPRALKEEIVLTLLPKVAITLEGTLENGKLTFVCEEKKLVTRTGNIKQVIERCGGIVNFAEQFVNVLKERGFPELSLKSVPSELEKICGVEEEELTLASQ